MQVCYLSGPFLGGISVPSLLVPLFVFISEFLASLLPCLSGFGALDGSRGGGTDFGPFLGPHTNSLAPASWRGFCLGLQWSLGSQVVVLLENSLLACCLKFPSLPLRFGQPFPDIPNSPPNMGGFFVFRF